MKISVAVPTYNYAQFLPACLDSIRQQRYENFEVLIADGGSSDGSIQIIEKYCDADSRFRFVSQSDAGQADAIKRAFGVASGDVLCFLNADDCYLSDKVFTLVVEAFKQDPGISVATFGGYYLNANGNKIKKINYRYHPMDGLHWMHYRTAVLQPATFWLKHVYDESVWPSSYHYVFDVVFFYQAYLCYHWREFSEPVAGYRLHGDNKSMTIRPDRVDELAAFEELKFGDGCFRSRYLRAVGGVLRHLQASGRYGSKTSKALYLIVNSLAFLTFYRLPGI